MSRAELDVVLCYDVAADGRRNRLHKRLQQWMRPVQYSVMEARLHPNQLDAIRRTVVSIIDPEVDSVRIYVLCGACRNSTLLLGTAEPLPDPKQPVMF